MPMVNGKEYAYTAKGMKAAKMEAMPLGRGVDPETKIGPVINEKARDKWICKCFTTCKY